LGGEASGAGQLLKEIEKHEGRRPKKTAREERQVSTLTDLGITRDRSSKWQKLEDVPREVFHSSNFGTRLQF
jgi:hypothetical protein